MNATGGNIMDREHEHEDIERMVKAAYEAPPPRPDFVESLGQRLGRELDLATAEGLGKPGAAPLTARRWRWAALPAAAAASLLLVLGVWLLRERGDPVPARNGQAKKPPFDIPWTPPRKVEPEAFWKQYGKYFEPAFLKRQGERIDKDLDVDTLHLVNIRTQVVGQGGTLFIDKSGNVVLAAPYPLASEFSEGLALVGTKTDFKKGNRITHYGYIDRTGRIAIPAEYESGTSFREGLAGVQKDGKWGFINRKGDVVIAPRYQRVEEFRDGVARAWPDHDTVEFIDPKGRVLFKGDGSVGRLSEGLFHANLTMPDGTQQRGYFDRDFKLVIRFDHRGKGLWPARCGEFHEGRAAVEIGANTWGFLDRDGKLVIPASFRQVDNFSEGLASVSMGPGVLDPRGYIDRWGKMVLEPRFVSAGSFKEGLACVLIPLEDEKDAKKHPAPEHAGASKAVPRGKWGFIDKTGRVVIEPRFHSATSFRHGLARVSENPFHVGFIDRTGAYVFQVHEPTYGFDQKR
jgi:hypothetical protein